jgi:hypothetical protein
MASKETGNLIKMTFSAGSGGTAITTTEGFRWTLRSRRRMWNTTPEQSSTDEEYTQGTRSGILDFWITHEIGSSTPPIPDGAIGSAVLYPDFINTIGKYYTCQILVMDFDFEAQANTGGQPNVWHYRCQCTLNGSTNGIVAT